MILTDSPQGRVDPTRVRFPLPAKTRKEALTQAQEDALESIRLELNGASEETLTDFTEVLTDQAEYCRVRGEARAYMVLSSLYRATQYAIRLKRLHD